MQLLCGVSDVFNVEASSLVLFCPESGFAGQGGLKELDKKLEGTIRRIFDSGEFGGKSNQSVVIHLPEAIPADRLILTGLGRKKEIDHDRYRQAAGTVSRLQAIKKSPMVAFFFGNDEGDTIASAVIEGFMLGRFCIDEYKTNDTDGAATDVIALYGKTRGQANRLTKGGERGMVVSEGAMLVRRLSALPGNDLTPRKLAAQASALARKHGFTCTVLDEKQIRAEKMNSYLGVAKGSAEPPRFIILKYQGGAAKTKPIVLIGKGITFDSGGISLKPGLDMHEMKSDMTGAACVLGAVMTAARLRLCQNVIGLIPLAENLPSGKALKPGDIITSRKGKTIEIVNTDAEGRLILIDALDYANEFNPQAVIDIATLTGGALYILGYAGALLMANNDKLKALIQAASDATAEKVWAMPIWEEYREWMKSSIADLKNSGGEPATSCTAGAFLEASIGDWPWAHIDIASVDIEKHGRPYIPKGSTGFGFRLLVELLARWKKV
ncbi:MAG: leucyl aminopeptidase [Candidatus Zixiibacteriota bacterium]|nr:MAG: leucyl aminopeptidase [candidate division Zixibacteria bacterium]